MSYSYPLTPSWNVGPPLSSPSAAVNNNVSPIYLSVTLQRSSIDHPWGISLALFPGRYLMIGHVNINSRILVQGRATHCPLCPSFLWKTPHVSIVSLTRHLLTQPAHGAAGLQPLLPGDCIIGVNGISLHHFESLSQISSLMKQSRQLHLLIVREASANISAQAVLDSGITQDSGCCSYQAAQAAHFVYARRVGAMTMTTPLVPPPPMVRQVTPERAYNETLMRTTYTHQPLVHKSPPIPSYYAPVIYKNSFFRDEEGRPIPYSDNTEDYDPDEGRRAKLFLPDISDVSSWLSTRKRQWRKRYRVYTVQDVVTDESYQEERSCITAVPIDFWKQEHASFDEWLATRTAAWKSQYSWNKRKRQRLVRDSDTIVHLNSSPFDEWLRVRRNQWKILRRQRQRQRRLKEQSQAATIVSSTPTKESPVVVDKKIKAVPTTPQGSPTSVIRTVSLYEPDEAIKSPEIAVIDALLEQQERERRAKAKRHDTLDISFLFDASLGCPDDVVAHCFQYLPNKEHAKLLAISRCTHQALQKRGRVWQQLCPSHWSMPRRPRKPWHELYLTRLRSETERQRKKWDELLLKAVPILVKADHLQSIEKLVTDAQRDSGFDVNYSSGVVCERNSLLNLAVIHQRHKVVKWLVEVQKADIESSDRGHFTPLLNAAWAGDRQLVRFLMQQGADRSKIGTGHYTRPLAHPDFCGLTAEGWAEKRGHGEIAKLIRLGL